MSDKSDTPRTDAAEMDDSNFSDWGSGPSGYCHADFARQLERELAEARAYIHAMVEKAASGGVLDGYRELGARAAAAELRAEKAEAECERLREDAERYLWVRVNPSKWNWVSAAGVFGWKTPDQIDAAIDAARNP